MVTNANILTGSQNSQLFAIQQTTRSLAVSQNRLTTGKDVNSPLDNPQNFFTSFSLSSRASDLNRVLDNISQSITAIQSAENSRGALSNLVNQAQSTTTSAIETLQSNQEDLGSLILADNPVVYYRLDETSGTTAVNLGSGGSALDGTYAGGFSLNEGALTFSLDNNSVKLDGTTGRVNIPNSISINTDVAGYPQRTVELTFQANNLSGRQVLFEEGGTGNSAAIYLDDDNIYFVARDAGDFGPFNISAKVEEGKTYQAAFVLDSDAASFIGYLNGEEVGSGFVNKPLNRHSGAVALGRNAGGTFFHDGSNAGNGEYFNGQISDFALYNTALTQSDLQARYDVTQFEQAEFFEAEVTELISEIDNLVEDSGVSGINLLKENSLRTNFSLNGSSSLLTEGFDLTVDGLGLEAPNFLSFSNIDKTVFDFDDAVSKIEAFGNSLASDLGIINTRQNFTLETINNLEAGSTDLTAADTQAESANVLIQQARQDLQTTTLSLSAKGSNIGDLLSQSSINAFFS